LRSAKYGFLTELKNKAEGGGGAGKLFWRTTIRRL